MKPFVLLASALFSSPCLAAKVLSFALSRVDFSPAELDMRDLSERATINEALRNNITQYQAMVAVGNPPQQFLLQIDTGSSDIYILDKTADQCTVRAIQAANHGGCYGGLFDSSLSTTFKTVLKGGFAIKYADQTGSSGDLIADDFSVGGQTVTALEMGLAFKTTTGRGVMGIGYDTNEASGLTAPYLNLIDQMVAQGLINSKTYSLYLNGIGETAGSILFGGLDTGKFIGTLQSVPIIPTRGIYREFNILVSSITFTDQTGVIAASTDPGFAQPFLLDSGTTLSYLPAPILTLIVKATAAVVSTSAIFIDCDLRMAQPAPFFAFQFGAGGPTINVPISEMILSLPGGPNVSGFPFKHVCVLALLPSTSLTILGDSFLRSAYVVYDLTHNQIGLAQANLGSTVSNIVELKATDSGLPSFGGVGNGVAIESITATPTIGFIVGGTATAVATSIASKSVGVLTSAAASASTAGLSSTASRIAIASASASTASASSAAAGLGKGSEGAAVRAMAFAFAGACVLLGASLL